MINTIAALLVGYLLGVLTVVLCVAAQRGDDKDELDPGHAGLFLVPDDDAEHD